MFCFERRQPFPFSRAASPWFWCHAFPHLDAVTSPTPVTKGSPASRTLSAFVSSGLRHEAGRPVEATWPLLLFPTQKWCFFLPGSSSLRGLGTSVHSVLPRSPPFFRCGPGGAGFQISTPAGPRRGLTGVLGRSGLLHRGEHLVASLTTRGSAHFLISGTSVLVSEPGETHLGGSG